MLVAVVFCVVTLNAQQKKRITPEIAFKSPPLQLTKQLPTIAGWQDEKSYIESKRRGGGEKPQSVIVDVKSGKELGEKTPEVNWDELKSKNTFCPVSDWGPPYREP